jgi:hypothetical protein
MARMYRIAISGHRGLPAPTARLVDQAIRAVLAERLPSVTGFSCPAVGYRAGLPADSHPGYDALFAQAAAVRRLPFTESTPESHMAASRLMVNDADELLAVWDGKPARAYGGTADVVAYAREHGTPVRVIWPDGAQRG